MHSKNNPSVSVIIPTFNRATFVTEAIESVLAQTYRDYEIIVVDDGSTDNTQQVLAAYKDKIRYIYQENLGLSSARNTGITNAKGKYIALLDSDDLWLPNKLEEQVQILEDNEDTAFVYSNFVFVNETGDFIKVGRKAKTFVSGHILKNLLLSNTVLYPSTWLVKKSCLEDVGFFNTEFKRSEEREMEIRIARKYKMHGIEEPLAKIRQINSVETLGRCAARDREYYRFKFLNKLFEESNGEPIIEKNKKRLTAHYYFIAGIAYLKEQNLKAAKDRFRTSIKNNPFRLKVYPYLFSCLLGERCFGVLNKLRKMSVHIKKYHNKLKYSQKYK